MSMEAAVGEMLILDFGSGSVHHRVGCKTTGEDSSGLPLRRYLFSSRRSQPQNWARKRWQTNVPRFWEGKIWPLDVDVWCVFRRPFLQDSAQVPL
jgi:hypothetical protein